MRQKSGPQTSAAEKTIKDIRRATRKHHSAGDKIRVVLEGLRGEDSIAAICRREGIAESLYYSWSKEFLEAGKKRLAGDTSRSATSDEVKALRKESRDLKEALGRPLQHSGAMKALRFLRWKCAIIHRVMVSFKSFKSLEVELLASQLLWSQGACPKASALFLWPVW